MRKPDRGGAVPAAARAFASLQAEDALLPAQASALKRSGAIFLAAMVLVSAPLFWAANAVGIIGDLPTAVAHSGNSGPGSGGDDDSSGPGSGDDDCDDDDTGTQTRSRGTDDTSANGHDTRGTTNDNDTRTANGTDDTSANDADTRGTTNDTDTRTSA